MADIIVGFSVVSVLSGVLGVMTWQTVKATHGLAIARAAGRAAESALTDLQLFRTPASTPGVTLEVLDEPNAAAPAGQRWVRVIATIEGHHAELIGLVPAHVKTNAPQTREAR